MALSNLVPVKKEHSNETEQNATKGGNPPTSDQFIPPISWNQRIESSTKTRGHNTIDHHLTPHTTNTANSCYDMTWISELNRILSCLVVPKCHPNDIIHMSYPVPSCASFNGNADVAASLLSAGNANKAVNVAPRHEELVIQQGLSRRNASKDLDFRTSGLPTLKERFNRSIFTALRFCIALKLVNLCTRSKLQRSQGTKINER